MNDLINKAMKVAVDEAAVERNVMVLVPTMIYIPFTLLYPRNPYIHIRASTIESSLKSLPIDTLILIGQSDPKWNKKGELYARERLKASATPYILVVNNP